jgi:hypothetical protein
VAGRTEPVAWKGAARGGPAPAESVAWHVGGVAALRERPAKAKTFVTRYSRVVPHLITDRAYCIMSSEFGMGSGMLCRV